MANQPIGRPTVSKMRCGSGIVPELQADHCTCYVPHAGHFANGRRQSFFEDYGVWKEAPVLTGSTKFTPLPDVKNIMITGGAGFMYDASSGGRADRQSRAI